MEKEKRILLITTGGTIGASTNAKGARVADDNSARGADLLSSVRAKIASKGHNISITAYDAYNIDSSNLNPNHWKQIIKIIVDNYDKHDSFIITHGTDTMSYTAAALSFGLGNLGKPVLLTGSQVPFFEYGDDARTNLENCVRIIHESQERLRGVFVIIGSSIMAGPRVKKLDDTKYQAFRSYGSVDLAQLGATFDISYNSNITEYMDTYGVKAESAAGLKANSKFDMGAVFIVPEHPGVNLDVIKEIIKSKSVKVIVWRGYGVGNPNLLSQKVLSDSQLMKKNLLTGDVRDLFELAQKLKKPIIMTTDVEKSTVTMQTYDPGIIALTEYGVIPTFDMSQIATVVKAAYHVANNVPYERFKAAMIENLRGEIDLIKVKRFQNQMEKRGLTDS